MKENIPVTFKWRLANLRARLRWAIGRATGFANHRRRFKNRLGYPLNLTSPRTFNEKVQCRKIFDRNPLFPRMTDKAAARDYIDERLGPGSAERLMVPALAVVNRFEELDPALKDQGFMLKATHGCTDNAAVRPGSDADWAFAKERANIWINQLQGDRLLEWSYADLPPRLIAEELFLHDNGDAPKDLKTFCFGNRCEFFTIGDLRNGVRSKSYFDRDGQRMNVRPDGKVEADFDPPPQLHEMFDLAETLAADFDFLRVDFLYTEAAWRLGEL
ncbi:MAG: ATP-grasp fold amidoligase family protein, partial [Pseudomonadota bacterium]